MSPDLCVKTVLRYNKEKLVFVVLDALSQKNAKL